MRKHILISCLLAVPLLSGCSERPKDIDSLDVNLPSFPPFETLMVAYSNQTATIDEDGRKTIDGARTCIEYIDTVNNKMRMECRGGIGRYAARGEIYQYFTPSNPNGPPDIVEHHLFDGQHFYNWDSQGQEATAVKDEFSHKVWQRGEDYRNNIIGEETFLDWKCLIAKTEHEKVWIYKGVIVKSEIKLDNLLTTSDAVAIRENAKFPPSLFKLPGKMKINVVKPQESAQ